MSRASLLLSSTSNKGYQLPCLIAALATIFGYLHPAHAQSTRAPSITLPSLVDSSSTESSLTADLADPTLTEPASADRAKRELAKLLGESTATRTEAISLYQHLANQHPEDLDLWLALAELLVQEARVAEANDAMAKAIAGGISSPKALSLWAHLRLWNNKPGEALAIFLRLLPKGTTLSPNNAPDFLGLAQALARTGHADAATDILLRLLSVPAKSPNELATIHEELGLLNEQRGDLTIAANHFKEALEAAPNRLTALTHLAIVQSWLNPRAALKTIDSIATRNHLEQPLELALLRALAATGQRERARPLLEQLLVRDLPAELLAEIAHSAALLGFAEQASTVARRILESKELSIARQIELAGDLAQWGDSYTAKATLERVLVNNPDNVAAIAKLIALLESMWRLHEAKAIGEFFLQQQNQTQKSDAAFLPNSELLCALASVHLTARQPAAARDLLLAEDNRAIATCPETWLRVLHSLGKTDSIAMFLKQHGSNSSALSPLAHAKILTTLNRTNEAVELLTKQVRLDPEDISARALLKFLTANGERASLCARTDNIDELLRLGDLMKQGSISEGASLCFTNIVERTPDILVAKIELAEALAHQKKFAESINLYNQLLNHHPTNRRLALGRARALSWAQDYTQALRAYTELLASDPHDPVVITEAARVAIWNKDIDRANELYSKLLQPDVDQYLRELLTKAQLWYLLDDIDEVNDDALGRPGVLFAKLEQRLQDLIIEGPPLNRIHDTNTATAILVALRGRYQLQLAAWLEMNAQQAFYDGRLLSAEAKYCGLKDLEPWNQEALFGAAQVACTLGDRSATKEWYHQLLSISPSHLQAQTVIDQIQVNQQPALLSSANLWSEQGRGAISDITRYRFGLGLELHTDDYLKLRMSGVSFLERPGTALSEVRHDRNIAAQGFSFGGEFTPYLGTNLALTWIHKDYDSAALRSTDNGLAQAMWRPHDMLTAQLRLERRDEIANLAGILSDIQSNTATLGAEIRPASRLRFNLEESFSRFDDSNHGYRSFLVGGYEITTYPEVLRIAGVHEYRDTAHQGFLQTDALGSSTSFVHPYWTPNEYHLGGILLEWHQDSAAVQACGAPKDLFSAKLLLKNDTDQNPGIQFEIAWEMDILPLLNFNVTAMVHESEQWDAHGLWGALTYRFD